MSTSWQEHPDHPDMYYRREGRTVQLAGRDVLSRTEFARVLADNRPNVPEGNPVIHVSAEAAHPSKRMTLAELAAFLDQAKAAGVPDTAGLNVGTKGLGHLRKITTEDGRSE